MWPLGYFHLVYRFMRSVWSDNPSWKGCSKGVVYVTLNYINFLAVEMTKKEFLLIFWYCHIWEIYLKIAKKECGDFHQHRKTLVSWRMYKFKFLILTLRFKQLFFGRHKYYDLILNSVEMGQLKMRKNMVVLTTNCILIDIIIAYI